MTTTELQTARTPLGMKLDAKTEPRPKPMYFDTEGRPCTLGRWAEIVESGDRFLVIGHHAGRRHVVSTAFVGMLGWNDIPELYRTTVWRMTPANKTRFRARVIRDYRSATKAEAEARHATLVNRYVGNSKWVRRRGRQAENGVAREYRRSRTAMRRRRLVRIEDPEGTVRWRHRDLSPWKKPRGGGSRRA